MEAKQLPIGPSPKDKHNHLDNKANNSNDLERREPKFHLTIDPYRKAVQAYNEQSEKCNPYGHMHWCIPLLNNHRRGSDYCWH
jgi:hypothetical protein